MEHLQEYQEFSKSDELFELSNLSGKTTNLPMIIWVSENNAKHGPRIKVSRTYSHKTTPGDWFSVTISDNPEVIAGTTGDIKNKDIELVISWILLNKQVLLDYWNGILMTDELIEKLQKINSETSNV